MVWDLNLLPNIIVPIPVYYEFISDARLLGENSCFTEILSSPKFIPPKTPNLGQSCDPYHLSRISRIHHTFHVFKTSIQGFIWMAQHMSICVPY